VERLVKIKSGLSESVIEKLVSVFDKVDEIDEAVLFGSRAMGTFKEGSDIDIALKGQALNLALLRKTELKLEDLDLPYTIDLIIYHQIKEPLLTDHIDRVGICIYKKMNSTNCRPNCMKG